MLTTPPEPKKTVADDTYNKEVQQFEFEAAEAYLSSEGCEEFSGNQDFASMGVEDIHEAQKAECEKRDNMPQLSPRYQQQSPRFMQASPRERLL